MQSSQKAARNTMYVSFKNCKHYDSLRISRRVACSSPKLSALLEFHEKNNECTSFRQEILDFVTLASLSIRVQVEANLL